MKNIYSYCFKGILCSALFGSLLTNTTVSATPLSPEQALNRVKKGGKNLVGKVNPKLFFTEYNNEIPTVYIYKSNNEKCLVVSADNNSPALLGYYDFNNNGDSSTLPPAFKYWLHSISDEVLLNAKYNAGMEVCAPSGKAIAPMTATRWNQDLPFSKYCPTEDGKHCYTGCVATALAQILKYHNYPVTGSGSHSYTWKNAATATDTVLSFNYAETTFNWSDMLDKYGSDDSEASKDAVATLMYACGVAVNMHYGTDDSGADEYLLPDAMVNYFNFDKGTRTFVRDYYDLNDWNQLVYDQLTNYGPVQYTGFSNQGGHSFVCDGYSEDGYFHINWGWGGMSDGYFLLTILDPGVQGIGGSESGYNFSQSILGNASPQQTSEYMYENLLAQGSINIRQSEIKPGDNFDVTSTVINYSSGAAKNIVMGIQLTDESGNISYLSGPTIEEMPMEHGTGEFTVNLPSDIAEGKYTMKMAFCNTQGEWQVIPVKVYERNTYTLQVESGKASFTPGNSATVEVSDFINQTPFYLNSNFEMSALLTNPTDKEYIQNLRVTLVDIASGKVIARGDMINADVAANSSQQLQYLSKFTALNDTTTISPGYYNVYLSIENGDKFTNLAGPVEIYMHQNETMKLSIEKFYITDAQNKEDIQAQATVECTSGYYYGPLRLAIAQRKDGAIHILKWIDSSNITVQATDSISVAARDASAEDEKNFGSTATVEFSGAYDAGVEGEDYMAAVYEENTILSDWRKINFDSVITSVNNESTDYIEDKQIFTLQGTRVRENMPRGIYIVRTVRADGVCNSDKIVVR